MFSRALNAAAIPLLLVLTQPAAVAQQPPAEASLDTRKLFDSEVCAIDDLTPAQCQCAFDYLQKKFSARDLRIGLLLTASNSENAELSKKAYDAVEKANVSDKKRDELTAEFSAETVEAEDACP